MQQASLSPHGHYAAVVFDFDYTLGNSEEGIILSANYALHQMGHPQAERDAIRRTIGQTLPHTYATLTGDTDEPRAQLFTRLFMQRADEVMTENSMLYDGVLAMLHALRARGIAICIVTTKYVFRIEHIFEKYDALPLLDLIVGGDSVKAKKPDPEGLLLALRTLGLRAEQILYVGDSVVDAKTAATAQVDFCAVLTGTTPAEAFTPYHPMRICESVTALYEQLKKTALAGALPD